LSDTVREEVSDEGVHVVGAEQETVGLGVGGGELDGPVECSVLTVCQ